jgi:hypothetical protein
MNVHEAVSKAKKFTMEVFAEEKIADLGLEEVVRDDEQGLWRITLGFSRPWNEARTALTMLTGEPQMRRSYKVVTIKDASSEIVSLTNRDTQ